MARRIGQEVVRVFRSRVDAEEFRNSQRKPGLIFLVEENGAGWGARRALAFPQRDINGRRLDREVLTSHPLVVGVKGRVV